MHISVITPTKNRASSYLKDCVQSIAAQRLKDGWTLEHVICDDGSSVDEFEALQVLASGLPHIKIVRHLVSGGPAPARNSAFLASSGSIILDVDDDDFLPAETLVHRVDHLLSSGRSWSCGNLLKVDESLRYLVGQELYLPPSDVPADRGPFMEKLLSGSLFAWASTRTYLRQALVEAGPWDDSFPVAEDFEHWLRLTVLVGPPAWFFGPAAVFREKGSSLGINAAKDGTMAQYVALARNRYSNWSHPAPDYKSCVPTWEKSRLVGLRLGSKHHVDCSRCGCPQPSDYCPFCGESRPPWTACPRCHEIVSGYCPACGEKIEAQSIKQIDPANRHCRKFDRPRTVPRSSLLYPLGYHP